MPDLGSRQVRVLLVDDVEIVRRGLKHILGSVGFEVSVVEVDSALRALASLDEVDADVVVVEPVLADGDAIELCRQIAAAHDGGCLVLTAFPEERTLRAAFAAGAAAYLFKETDVDHIIDAVRTAAGGGTLLDEDRFQQLLTDIRSRQPYDARIDELTAQERRVLEALGEGMTNRQIAQRLGLVETTVRNYVSRLLSKLDMHRRTEAAALAAQMTGRQTWPPHYRDD